MATCPSIREHWRHLPNTIELVHPSAHSSPQPIRQMDRAYSLQWALLSTRIVPSHGGSGPPMQHMMLSAYTSPQHKRLWTRIDSAVFAQMTAECLYTLQRMVCLFSVKIDPSHFGIWTSFNTWFIGSTRVRNANGNLIVSVVFAGLTDWQRDRKTDRLYATQCDAA